MVYGLLKKKYTVMSQDMNVLKISTRSA